MRCPIKYSAGALKTGYHLTPFEDDAHAVQGIILHYEEQAFDKEKEKLKSGEFAFFYNQIKSGKIRPQKLPKPTEHARTYPEPGERNKPGTIDDNDD